MWHGEHLEKKRKVDDCKRLSVMRNMSNRILKLGWAKQKNVNVLWVNETKNFQRITNNKEKYKKNCTLY
jgi:hypothetical protein